MKKSIRISALTAAFLIGSVSLCAQEPPTLKDIIRGEIEVIEIDGDFSQSATVDSAKSNTVESQPVVQNTKSIEAAAEESQTENI